MIEDACECGCGEAVREGRRFVNAGHSQRRTAQPIQIDPSTGCWLWQWCISSDGYGRIKRDGKVIGAHRHYYAERYGPIPEDRELDHLCRVRNCVNPDHLEVVTDAENTHRGARAKLTPQAVRAIRTLHGIATARSVADEYGVSRTTIYDIWHGRKWVSD